MRNEKAEAAGGIVKAAREIGLKIPMVVRFEGTNGEDRSGPGDFHCSQRLYGTMGRPGVLAIL